MKKFSKAFGQVEILEQNNTTTTVKIVATGEIKKLLNQFANLQDAPFEAPKKVKKQPLRDLTREEEIILAREKNSLINIFNKSTQNYRSGKSGASSLY